MNWLFCVLLCVILVELVMRLPFGPVIATVTGTSMKSVRIMGSSTISDHWKEKAMGAYARRTFTGTLKLAGLLVLLFGIASAVILLFGLLVPGFPAFILSWTGLTATLVIASLYAVIRRKVP